MSSITVEKHLWLDAPQPAAGAQVAEGSPGQEKPDLVAMAEQEADRTGEFEQIAEAGAVAAAEAVTGAEKKPDYSPDLAPLARLAAEKSQDAASMARESSKTVNDLGAMVREAVGGGGLLDANAVPRVSEATTRAEKSAERAGASAKRARSSAERVKSILSDFEGEQAKPTPKVGGQGGVLAQQSRTIHGRADRPSSSSPALPAQSPATPKPLAKKVATKRPTKGLMGKIMDALTE